MSTTAESPSTDPQQTELHFDTLKVHGGYDPSQHQHASSVPIYQTAAYTLETVQRSDALFAFENDDPLYTRLSNPTVNVLQQRLAELHGVSSALALASGMAAVSYTLLNVAGRSGRILTNYRLYGGTLDGFSHIFPELGVDFDVARDPDDPASYDSAINERTKAIYVESISNPQAAVVDLEPLADIAHAHGIPLIVDNTIATPFLLNPFDFGADIVVYSATKALSGHGNVIAGAVLENGRFDYAAGKHPQFTQPLWFLRDGNDAPRSIVDVFPDNPFTGRLNAVHLNYLGAALGPFDAYMVLIGLETLSERVTKQVANTQQIVSFLTGHEHVSWISYPTSPGSRYERLAAKYLPKGAGSVLSFGLEGGADERRKFLEATRIFSFQANLGDAKSLIINPAQTTHIELSNVARQAIGLTNDTIRLSLGLENADDLKADLEHAFSVAFA